MKEDVLQDVEVKKMDNSNFFMGDEEGIKYEAKPSNPVWLTFTKYVKDNQITYSRIPVPRTRLRSDDVRRSF